MPVGETLKETYFNLEEKWYNALDKIDEHIPVYKVVDKIDNVVPSFALLLILIFILILLLIIGSFGLVLGGESILKLTVVDAAGNGVSAAAIEIEGVEGTFFSNDFGLVDDITVPAGYTITLRATKEDQEKTMQITIDESEIIEQVVLPIDGISFASRTLQFVNETGALITDELNLSYTCSSGATPPASETIYDGTTNLDVPSNCSNLLLSITSNKYETKTTTITNASTTITLNEKTPTATARAVVNLNYNGELISESVRVSAYKANNSFIPEETISSTNGVAVFDLPVGDYIFETKQEQGYVKGESEVVNVNETSEASTTIELSKSILGSINVIVKRGNTELEDVLVTLRKDSSALDTEKTDIDGNVSFELAQEGPFIVVATKEDYCQATSVAEIGDTIELDLERDTGECGGELKIKVVDSDNDPVRYARILVFGEDEDNEYKLNYDTVTTDFNGVATINPVIYSEEGEEYKVFAYKGSISGWSEAREFTSLNENEEYLVTLELEEGIVNVVVNDNDGDPVQFAEVRLYEDFGNDNVTGKRIVQDTSGLITFNVLSGQRVYAVVEREGYESYTTLPKEVIGNGSINFEVTLSRPPLEELFVDFVGLYKNDKKVLRAQPGEEYIGVFEITAPINYEELGFFVRVGEENVSKTEMDKLYIEELIVPHKHEQIKGASYNPPRGYNIDQDYLNLEESKWAQSIWQENDYKTGKIRVGAIIKIKQNARLEDQLEIAYRAWGLDSSYERDPVDNVLGTTESNSSKNALYASTKKAYAWIGVETLCEAQGDNEFCISSTYTDPDGIKNTFDNGFDAKNNTNYILSIKASNASALNFEDTSVEIDNTEDNILIGEYNLIAPDYSLSSADVEGYETGWIDLGDFRTNTEFSFSSIDITPQATGYGSLLFRIRDSDSILFTKTFGINILSDKKMSVEYLVDGDYVDNMPSIASGRKQNLTLRAINNANELEINDALVKLYDRFGSKIYETTTNKLGLATIEIPASLPDELLKIKVEKSEFETKEIEFRISKDIVEITPEKLSFTVNPQTKEQDTKTVKVENKTGFDLEIKDIYFDGKTKGLISESRMDSWFANYVGTDILSNDYEEIEFAVISSPVVPTAGDIEGKFIVTVGNDVYSWVQEIDTKIRVGLGNDVDNPDCLEVTQTNWNDETQGEEIEFSFEVKNNCLVEGQAVPLRNLGAKIEPSTNVTGKFSAQSVAAYTELSRGYARTFKPVVNEEDVVPVTLKFTPYGGTSGATTGTITFEAINPTDSTNQVLTATLDYEINIINSDCLVIGSDLISIAPEEAGSFSVTNNCTTSATFSIDSDLPISNSTFSLDAGGSQDVTIQRNAGDIPGAYNNLVNARLGSGRQELIGNVKAILESDPDSCFTMTRFEFDVYNSPTSEFDGVDRGYVHNNCTQKTVPVSVYGEEEFDWDKVLQDMLVGAIAGLIANDFQLLPDGWLEKEEGENNSEYAARTGNETQKRFDQTCLALQTDLQKNQNRLDELERKINEVEGNPQEDPEINQELEDAKIELTKINTNLLNEQTEASTKLAQQINETRSTVRTKIANLQNEVNSGTKNDQEIKTEITELIDEEYLILEELVEKINQELQNSYSSKEARMIELVEIINKNSDEEIKIPKFEPIKLRSKGEIFGISDDTTGRNYSTTSEDYELHTITYQASNPLTTYTVSGPNINQVFGSMDAAREAIDNASNEPVTEETEDTDWLFDKTPSEQSIRDDYIHAGASINQFEKTDNKITINYSIDEKTWTHIYEWNNSLGEWELNITPEQPEEDTLEEIEEEPTGAFLLNQPRTLNTGSSGGLGGLNLDTLIGAQIINVAGGAMGGSALGGALLTGVLSILQGQDTTVEYSETFAVPLVEITGISLENDGGISMSVGEPTYDYDQYYQNLASSSSGASYYNGPQNGQGYTPGRTANNNSGQGLTNRNNFVFNPQALTATTGLVEIRELEFTNPSNAVNANPYEPFKGIVTVSGEEKVYENDYDYSTIKDAAKERGELEDNSGNFLEEIINPSPTVIASITEEDLAIKEIRNYEKRFHVLFNSYEYVECGPNTYPCAPVEFGNCTVGSKTGITGTDAVPKLLLDWDFARIDADACDESNSNYSYCDVTQSTISTFKKINYMKDFFNSNQLTECPSAIDVAGTASQELNGNEIDVAITSIRMSQDNDNTNIEVVVRTNNAQELGAEVRVEIRDRDTDNLIDSYSESKDFTSDATYNFTVDDSVVTTGQYNVVAELDIDLCNDCENNDITNDSLTSTLIMGAEGAQECQSYDTRKDYFEDVLAANNINDARALDYVNFTINLTRDSFSNDFKEDLDAYLMSFTNVSSSYTDTVRELFLSDKFDIEWGNEPGAWRAGKYNARLIIEFNNETWEWQDNNDIKSITLDLEYFGEPYPNNPIYNIGFNGSIGLSSDNGRQGYGVNYTQASEESLAILEGSNAIFTTPNPLSNTPTEVGVEVDDSFYNMNFTRPGNILTVNRVGENVDLTLSPSIAVPVILDITRDDALDAYAFYSVEANGQPQNSGSKFMNWTGIGQGCVDHSGASMTTWFNSPDYKNDAGDGYGLRWNNTIASGTASFYGVFYVPEDASATLRIMSQSETANFISNQGNGQQIVVDSGSGIRSIKDVFDRVASEEVCVIGGEYFWNNAAVLEDIESEIDSRENSCMTISN
jgi:hypothetical protein